MSVFLKLLGSQYHHARRYNRIIGVLTKYGFEDYVAGLEERHRFKFLRKLVPEKRYRHALQFSKWEKMRMVCEELGPTFIKFGQVLSNRPDLLPRELVHELEKLQDKVPPFSAAEAKRVLGEELNQPLEDIFSELEEQPFASASIAQVHKAVLRDGSAVVLKIQRPGIRETVREDISIMKDVADILVERLPQLKSLDLPELIHNFEESLVREMDFINESINIQRFQYNLKDDPEVHVPKVYKQYTTRNLLTLEFIDGIKVSEHEKLLSAGLDRRVIAKRIIASYYKQVFEYGFFHADPHAGNIFVLPDNRICFIDFGMMGSVLKKDIDQLASLFLAIFDKNIKKIEQALQQLSESPSLVHPKRFEYDLYEFVNTYGLTKVHQNEMSSMVGELRQIVVRHELQVPAHFFLLSRSMVTVEGVVRQLDPHLKLLNEAKPHLEGVIRRKLNPVQIAKRIASSAADFGLYLEDLPGDLRETINKIKTGKIKVDLEHKGIDPLLETAQRITKQVIAAIFSASLIIGSSLLIVAGMPPLWKGVSALGIIGLVLAAVIAFGMLRNISRSKSGY